ncbi:MAG: 23S rRNA (uracil(1939)-C(5))-methyltransferase RlmD [Defluviitaleaceae bacterium]|nr:23S rRNA (uracil(1939)-C(5))-methyltransferase RlmD [Defluviitaleaceae bacterium]
MEVCKYFGACGGCAYLNIPYEEELAEKERALRDVLGTTEHLLEGVIPAPASKGYRNKMELAFGDESKDGRLALGMRKRRSFYEVASLEECQLIPDDFRKIALYTQGFFRETGEAFYHRKRHIGSLRHLVLRRGEFTGEILINLSTTSSLQSDLWQWVSGLKALELDGEMVGILHSVNDGVADVVKDEDIRVLLGRDYFYERICGLDFKVTASSFFQTNSAGAEKLYGVVNDMAPSQNVAYDLYCGTGTIAQVLSPNFEKVIGVELNAAAIAAAKENAKLNGITNCEFYAGDVTAVLNEKTDFPIAEVTIVDPPRDGLHPKALAKLIEIAPPNLIYVACKPASLARDLVTLIAAGYEPIRAIGVDMFPRTPHVELVMFLRFSKKTKNILQTP